MRRARHASSKSCPNIDLPVRPDIGVVGVEGESDRRVVQLRPLFERDGPDPVGRARRAVGRREAVAGFAQGNEARADEADVAGNVGIDEVLGRRLIEPQRGEELVPIVRGVTRMIASAVVSLSPSPVNASAIALPGPASPASSGLTSDSTGPWRVARICSATSGASLTWIVSSRVSNGFGPSGVRYC